CAGRSPPSSFRWAPCSGRPTGSARCDARRSCPASPPASSPSRARTEHARLLLRGGGAGILERPLGRADARRAAGDRAPLAADIAGDGGAARERPRPRSRLRALGQYVVLLRERGWRAVGVDWSVDAVATARKTAEAPLAAAELTALPLRDGAAAAYVSLGVAEHEPSGPDAILAEARRVLAPGGALVVSTPYVNGIRQLATPYLRFRARVAARRGAAFYQFAFTRGELLAALRRHGFTPRSVHPYDPARVVLKVLPAAWRRRLRGAAAPTTATTRASAPRSVKGWVRGLLYTDPALRLFGHMVLVVAQRR